MDCLVRLFYGGSVRKQDVLFEDMEEEMEMFDDPPSFSELVLRLKEKFDGDFTLKGRFDSGKARAHFVLMPLRNEDHWLRYLRVIQGSNVSMAEVLVEDGFRKQDGPSSDGFEGDEQQGVDADAALENIDLDGQLTHEALHCPPMAVDDVGRISNDFDVADLEQDEHEQAVHGPPMAVDDIGCISNDFDVADLERDEHEQEEEERIGEEDVSSDSDGSDDDTSLQMCRKSLYDHENAILQKGMLFNTMSELKLFLQDYAVYHHRPYIVTHSDRELRYHVICKAGCLWRLNARKRKSNGKWKITKVVQPHTCLSNKGKKYHPQLTACYLARRILGLVDDNNDVSVSYLIQSILGFTCYEVNYGMAWRAKQIALKFRWGSWKEAYNRIPRILCAMAYYNPGLKWFIDTGGKYSQNPHTGEAKHILKRVFWSFAQTEHAFQYCRPVILVDGTFLTGQYRGVLMMAAAVDPEDQIVPMAFALTEGGNLDSWSWFMRLLRVHVLGPSRIICMISDHHAGLLNAAEEHIDGCPPLVHRWCMRHFVANFWRSQRKKEVCDKLKALCCVRTEHDFEETRKELDRMLNREGKAWLEGQMQHKAKWALAYDDGGFRYGIMTTNSSESFNRVFKGVRALPVSGVVEFSFHKCNEYFVKRWPIAQTNLATDGVFGKAGREHLHEAECWAEQETCEAYGPNRQVYNVGAKDGTTLGSEHYGGCNYRVDLDKVECSCNAPQIMHAPCSHMIAACRARGYDYKALPYMSPMYLQSNTMSIWQSSFEPYLDPSQWPPYHGEDYVPDPDLLKVGKGRRKNKRLKGDMDTMRGYGDGVVRRVSQRQDDGMGVRRQLPADPSLPAA